MITTSREDLDRAARSLRDHGASRSDLARHEGNEAWLLADYNHRGYNYRLTDIQGALGCAQMERAQWILDKRAQRARLYDNMLAKLEWLEIPKVSPGYIHGYQAYVCLFRPEAPTLENVKQLHQLRNQIMKRLDEKGIATRQGTHAPVILDYYARKYGLSPDQFPNAYFADRLSLTLPLYPQLTVAEQESVVDGLKRTFESL